MTKRSILLARTGEHEDGHLTEAARAAAVLSGRVLVKLNLAPTSYQCGSQSRAKQMAAALLEGVRAELGDTYVFDSPFPMVDKAFGSLGEGRYTVGPEEYQQACSLADAAGISHDEYMLYHLMPPEHEEEAGDEQDAECESTGDEQEKVFTDEEAFRIHLAAKLQVRGAEAAMKIREEKGGSRPLIICPGGRIEVAVTQLAGTTLASLRKDHLMRILQHPVVIRGGLIQIDMEGPGVDPAEHAIDMEGRWVTNIHYHGLLQPTRDALLGLAAASRPEAPANPGPLKLT